MTMTKSELRKHFSKIRKIASCSAFNDRITERILDLPEIHDADTVLMYASFGSEPSTTAIARELMRRNKRIAFPKCGENGIMTFHCVNSLDELHEGKFDIPEPDGTSEIPEITHKTVCIVPGLAFSPDGHRLGYGGGFYDRFLSRYPHIFTVGLAYEKCIADMLPALEHDVKINTVATEERLVLCNE